MFNDDMGMPGDWMFNVFPFLFLIAFIFIFGSIIVSIFKSAKQKQHNATQPVLTVECKIATKRMNQSTLGSHDHHHHRTEYYITFEVESGDRLEFEVPDFTYGQCVEGDMGRLTFQGTEFKGFQRQKISSL